MPPVKRTKHHPVSLGTFGEDEARHIASMLLRLEGIHATVENLVTDSGATVWWHVLVPIGSLGTATTWISGWRARAEIDR